MFDATRPITKNYILKALPEKVFERLLPGLERVDLPHGEYLFRSHEKITHVYFLDDAMASVVASTESGQSAEVGVIGHEGAAGLDVLMGADTVPYECMIQIPNGGCRIKTGAIKKEFETDSTARQQLLRFIHKFMVQISQTALCNRLHTVEERLSRWLLMCHDRVEGDKINLTQEFLAVMLGVTRTSVTLSAIALQDMGFIKYSRGTITIVDRRGLEKFSCECYRIVKAEYDRK